MIMRLTVKKFKNSILYFTCLFFSKFLLKKPNLFHKIKLNIYDFRSLYLTILNSFCYGLNLDKSAGVTKLAIELANSCNLNCKICPLNKGKMTRKIGYMSYDLFKKIVDQIPKIKLLGFSIWGEPFLHPQVFDFIHYAKKRGKLVTITSNGTFLTNPEKRKKLLDSGVDYFSISVDGLKKTYTQIRGYDYDSLVRSVKDLVKERNAVKSNMKICITAVGTKEVEEDLQEFTAMWKPIVDEITVQAYRIHNEPIKDVRKNKCLEPWRGAVCISYDGKVIPCCQDFNCSCILGDLRYDTIEDIYNNKKFRKFRKDMAGGNYRPFCLHCIERSSNKISKSFEL